MAAKLISIIGPPGCGKTTLAELLATSLPAEIVREDYAGNPFLARSYEGDAKARLPGQLYFLMSRVGQLGMADWPAEGIRVSDYGFCQDRIFARNRLSKDEYSLYGRVAKRVEELVRPPDVLIHLDAPETVLIQRIARRGRGFERVMDEAFLKTMRGEYALVAQKLSGLADSAQGVCPVIRIDCRNLDVRVDEVLKRLTLKLKELLTRENAPCMIEFC